MAGSQQMLTIHKNKQKNKNNSLHSLPVLNILNSEQKFLIPETIEYKIEYKFL